jgi:hypothetical protein
MTRNGGTALGVLGLVFVLTGCGNTPQTTTTPTQGSTAPAASTAAATLSSAAEDPYEVYLRNAPPGAPHLTREDAQTRALLGCGRKWAPGTVDAVLADAYAELCKSAPH